jgi:hypothetical protein
MSLVLMGVDAITVLQQEPMTGVLRGLVLDQRQMANPGSHGYYLPALAEARRLLSLNAGNSTCALMLLFLSDGVPSDRTPKGPGSTASKHAATMGAEVAAMSHAFGKRFVVGTVGFGAEGNKADFSVLQAMAQYADNYGGAKVAQPRHNCKPPCNTLVTPL